MTETPNPSAPHHLPWFITEPGQTDGLLVASGIFLLVVLVALGNLYFQLHALPERWAHKRSPVQLQIVAVLAILALFTHNSIFWVAALLLALVQLPDFATPIYSMADSLKGLAGRSRAPGAASGDSGTMSADSAPAGEEPTQVANVEIVEVTVIEPADIAVETPTKGRTDA